MTDRVRVSHLGRWYKFRSTPFDHWHLQRVNGAGARETQPGGAADNGAQRSLIPEARN
jgi:hypothetical protein